MSEPIILRTCDICGKTFMQDYGYSIAAMWAVTGFHEGVSGYECEHGQTWGCTPEHAMEAHMNCLQHDEHLSVAGLKKKHQDAIAKGYKRVEDKHLERYNRLGEEEFHLVSNPLELSMR